MSPAGGADRADGAHGADGASPLRLGLVSLDFPSWRACVDEAAERQLQAVEIYVGPDPGTPGSLGRADGESLRRYCDERGVFPVVVSCLAKLSQAEEDLPQHLDLIATAIDLAAAVGAPSAGFMYGGCASLGRHAARDRFLRRIDPLVARARRAGVRLLIENVFSRSPGGDLDTVDHALDLLSCVDTSCVALNFDAGNFAIAGEEAYPYAFQALRDRIGGIHLKDVARYQPARHPDPRRSRPLQDHARGLFLTEPLGEGSLNCSGLVRALLAWPGCPPVMLEPFCGGPQRQEWLDQSLAFIESVKGAA
jgi:sugar phosphate isomerase/epimerase